MPFYGWQYDRPREYRPFNGRSAVETIGADKAELMRVTEELLDYMAGRRDSLDGIRAVVYGVEREFFSDLEKRHMIDVRILYDRLFIVRNISAILLALAVVLLIVKKFKPLEILARCTCHVFIGFLSLITLLALIISIDFDRAWTIFHHIFFRNDYWLLTHRVDLLIDLVSLSFFLHISIFVGSIVLFCSALVITASCLYLRNKRLMRDAKRRRRRSRFWRKIRSIFFRVLYYLLVVIITIIAILVVIILLILLAFPIKYEILAKYDKKTDLHIKARYLFGLLRFEMVKDDYHELKILWFGKRKKVESEDPADKTDKTVFSSIFNRLETELRQGDEYEDDEVEKEPKKSLVKNLVHWKEHLTSEPGKTIIRRVLKTVKKLLRRLKPKHVELEARIGFDDPSKTGMMLGLFEMVSAIWNKEKYFRLYGEFNIDETLFEMDAKVRGSIYVLGLLFPVVILALKKPIRPIVFKAIFERKKTNERGK